MKVYKPGDRIEINGIKGDVIDSIYTTMMEIGEWISSDNCTGRIVKLSNAFVFKGPVYNYWFSGGEEGVYKYDGEKLILISTKDGLCTNRILGIQEDHLGNIYFDSDDVVCKFDGKSFTALKIIGEASKNEWKLEPHDLWFKMGWDNNGPYRYDGKFLYPLEFPNTGLADTFNTNYPNATFSPVGVYSIYEDQEGAIWFGTSSVGACRFDGKTISWVNEHHLVETEGGANPGIRSILQDKEGFYWFSNTRFRYNITEGSTEKDGTSFLNYERKPGLSIDDSGAEFASPYFMSIAEDNDGVIWLATYSGGVFRSEGNRLVHFPIKVSDAELLLFAIYKDNHGVLWLLSHNEGVLKFNGQSFEKLVFS